MHTPAKPWRKNKAHFRNYIDFPRHMSICCKRVDLVFAFNGKHCVARRQWRGHWIVSSWRQIGRKRVQNERRSPPEHVYNCHRRWFSQTLGNVFAAYVCVIVKVSVCASFGAALTRSQKDTSLTVEGGRSHRVFPLIHTGLASTVPVVRSARQGNTKLRHQLPGSHSRRSRENTAKLNNTFPPACWHMCFRTHMQALDKRTHTHLHSRKTISDPSQWRPLPVGRSTRRSLLRIPPSASYDWLAHTSMWLLNRLTCTVDPDLVPIPSPMGAGDNLTFIEIQLQWVQGGWRSSFNCRRWDGGRDTSRLRLSAALRCLSSSPPMWGIIQQARVNFVVHPNMVNNSV